MTEGYTEDWLMEETIYMYTANLLIKRRYTADWIINEGILADWLMKMVYTADLIIKVNIQQIR